MKSSPLASLLVALILCLLSVQSAFAGLVVTSAPTSTQVVPGGQVTWNIVATSNRTIRYYWYKSGVIVGKTKTLTITNAAASNAGDYTCLVNDGRTKYRCKTFSLTVREPTIIQLTWNHPTLRTNGSSLAATEIAGYNFYMGGTATTMVPQPRLAAVESLLLTDLPVGDYWVALETVDTRGLTSTRTVPYKFTVQ